MNQLRSLRFAFLGLLLLSGIANLCVPSSLDFFDVPLVIGRWKIFGVFVGILNGLLIGEFLSLAFWILLDPISLHRKFLLGFCGGFFLSTCLIVGCQVWDGMPMAAAILMWVVGVLFPFAFAVSLRGWSALVLGKSFPLRLVPGMSGQSQFGIGFLLSAMSALAIAFAVIRVVLPPVRENWLSGVEFLSVGIWFIWLVIATSMFTLLAFATVVLPTRVRIGSVILLTILGQSIFQLVASLIVVGQFRFDFQPFEPLSQSTAIGLLISGVILGIVYRLFGQRASPSSPNTDSFPLEPPSPLSP